MTALSNNFFVCLNCKYENTYKLKLPIAIACRSCGFSYLVDETKSVSELVTEPIKLKTISILNLHSKGKYKGESFELIGFIRSVNTLSISNEWLMYFESGKYQWLTESAFRYFVADPKVIPMSSHVVKGVLPGNGVIINSKAFVLVEITKQIGFFFQGEIPAECHNDSPYFKYELIAKDESDFATVQIYSAAQIDANTCEKVELEDLELDNTEPFKNWK